MGYHPFADMQIGIKLTYRTVAKLIEYSAGSFGTAKIP
jgi:hypothetical protein